MNKVSAEKYGKKQKTNSPILDLDSVKEIGDRNCTEDSRGRG